MTEEIKEKTFCKDCGNRQFLIKVQGTVLVAYACPKCSATCKICDDRRYIFLERDGYSYAQPCRCQKLYQRINIFNQTQIPALYRDKLWRPLVSEGSYTLHPKQEKAFLRVFDWSRTYTEGADGFLLMGPCGTGKTLLLCWALGYLALRFDVSCRYVEFSLLLEEMREQVRGGATGSLKSPLREVTVLAVDELGKIRGTDWELAELDSLITARYQAGKTTLFATNYTDDPKTTYQSGLSAFADRSRRVYAQNPFAPQIIGAGGDHSEDEKEKERGPSGHADTLRSRVGTRIYSRLKESCEFIEIDGEDYRIHQRRENL